MKVHLVPLTRLKAIDHTGKQIMTCMRRLDDCSNNLVLKILRRKFIPKEKPHASGTVLRSCKGHSYKIKFCGIPFPIPDKIARVNFAYLLGRYVEIAATFGPIVQANIQREAMRTPAGKGGEGVQTRSAKKLADRRQKGKGKVESSDEAEPMNSEAGRRNGAAERFEKFVKKQKWLEQQRQQYDSDWNHDYKATLVPRNARMALASLKLSLKKAVEWVEAVTNESLALNRRLAELGGNLPRSKSASRGRVASHSTGNSVPASAQSVDEKTIAIEELALYSSGELPPGVLVALTPHVASKGLGGGCAGKEKLLCVDLQRRKALCRAIAGKLRRPPTTSPASPEMVTTRVRLRPTLPNSPLAMRSTTEALADDILHLEVEENMPLSVCKVAPKHLLLTGSSMARPILLEDSPSKTPSASKVKGKKLMSLGLPHSPPSVNRLVLGLAESAKAHMKGKSTGSPYSKGIEGILGQLPNVHAVPGDHLLPPVPTVKTSQFCNLSTQSIQWILDELDFDADQAAQEPLVDYAKDSESI